MAEAAIAAPAVDDWLVSPNGTLVQVIGIDGNGLYQLESAHTDEQGNAAVMNRSEQELRRWKRVTMGGA